MSVEDRKITVNGRELSVSPLRCRHLREISKMLKNPESKQAQDFSSVDRWLPFMFDSIKVNNPDFTQDMLDDASLQEFNDGWNVIVAISGVQLVTKGEAKPATKNLTGSGSSDELPPAVVSPIVQ